MTLSNQILPVSLQLKLEIISIFLKKRLQDFSRFAAFLAKVGLSWSITAAKREANLAKGRPKRSFSMPPCHGKGEKALRPSSILFFSDLLHRVFPGHPGSLSSISTHLSFPRRQDSLISTNIDSANKRGERENFYCSNWLQDFFHQEFFLVGKFFKCHRVKSVPDRN